MSPNSNVPVSGQLFDRPTVSSFHRPAEGEVQDSPNRGRHAEDDHRAARRLPVRHASAWAGARSRQSGAALVLVMARPGGVPEPESYLQSVAQTAGIEHARTAVFEDRLAASAILLLAQREPDALVCMTTHGRSGPGVALFGSISEEVMRRVDVPIVLAGPSVNHVGNASFEELIVCLDGSRKAASILPLAAGFCPRPRARYVAR